MDCLPAAPAAVGDGNRSGRGGLLPDGHPLRPLREFRRLGELAEGAPERVDVLAGALGVAGHVGVDAAAGGEELELRVGARADEFAGLLQRRQVERPVVAHLADERDDVVRAGGEVLAVPPEHGGGLCGDHRAEGIGEAARERRAPLLGASLAFDERVVNARIGGGERLADDREVLCREAGEDADGRIGGDEHSEDGCLDLPDGVHEVLVRGRPRGDDGVGRHDVPFHLDEELAVRGDLVGGFAVGDGEGEVDADPVGDGDFPGREEVAHVLARLGRRDDLVATRDQRLCRVFDSRLGGGCLAALSFHAGNYTIAVKRGSVRNQVSR